MRGRDTPAKQKTGEEDTHGGEKGGERTGGPHYSARRWGCAGLMVAERELAKRNSLGWLSVSSLSQGEKSRLRMPMIPGGEEELFGGIMGGWDGKGRLHLLFLTIRREREEGYKQNAGFKRRHSLEQTRRGRRIVASYWWGREVVTYRRRGPDERPCGGGAGRWQTKSLGP